MRLPKLHRLFPLVLVLGCASSPPTLDLVPAPRSLEHTRGAFAFESGLTVEVDPAFDAVAARQLDALRAATGLPLAAGPGSAFRIELDHEQPAEGYVLETGPAGLRIAAADEAGVFYAFQTLRQLLPPEVESTSPAAGVVWRVPAVVIRDAPRFAYRGLHLDVGRHFFDVEVVKRYIDRMARFKLNRFHWHLTEDQGWRVQIDAYPRLTEIGAWRAESPVGDQLDPYVGDGTPHGGFYTKDEIREVVAYAAERFVTVVPEIEMPGHATAALAAYPELGCTGEPLEVETTWGIHDTVFCPWERTFEFLETVLDEVLELFPSELIHVGGDEVPKRQWQENAEVQALMEREGLANEEELQSWFIRRIEAFLSSRGRSLMGWDEILEGGIAPNATVMSWRGWEGGIAAARQGHDVVMTPAQFAYLDFYQGDPATEPLAMNWAQTILPLARVYEFEPVPDELTEDEARHVLGGQGNVWTEYIATPEHLDYMVYPRALALAEVLWSPGEARSWDGFRARLPGVLERLDRLGVRYRPLDPR